MRKEIYKTHYALSDNFPEKPEITAELNEEIAYSRELVEKIKYSVDTFGSGKAQKLIARVESLLKDDKIKEIQSAVDENAKLGYKSEENSFFGYKTHIAMTDERIIAVLEVTTGEAPDGPELVNLIEKSKDNLEYTEEHGIALISKLNPVISSGNGQQKVGFTYNKNADMFVCPAGHLACRKACQGKKNQAKKPSYDILF